MPINKIISSFDEAVADIHDGATVMIGGFGNVVTMPSLLIEALARKGVKDLTIVSNTTGFGADIWKLMGHVIAEDADVLFRNRQVKKVVVSSPVNPAFKNTFEVQYRAGEIEMEIMSQGTLAERIRLAKAGLGPVYIPVGIGTVVEEGKEKRVFDGREYLLEHPITADFALIKAHKGDRWGNLVYHATSRNFNQTMAGAADITIAEVDEIAELGALDPESIVTPAVYVDKVVARPEDIIEIKTKEAEGQQLDEYAVDRNKKFMETWKGKAKKED